MLLRRARGCTGKNGVAARKRRSRSRDVEHELFIDGSAAMTFHGASLQEKRLQQKQSAFAPRAAFDQPALFPSVFTDVTTQPNQGT